jgi:hypothetical protein
MNIPCGLVLQQLKLMTQYDSQFHGCAFVTYFKKTLFEKEWDGCDWLEEKVADKQLESTSKVSGSETPNFKQEPEKK